MARLTLILVRHGHVEGIRPEKFRGQSDLPLTKSGVAQAEATAAYLNDFPRVSAIYASPLSRCVDTATIIGTPQRIVPVPLPELIDINYGSWQGRIRDEISREEPARFHDWMTRPDLTIIPQADTLAEVQARLVRGLSLLRGRHEDQTVIAVGHDSSNRILLLTALELPLSRYWNIRQDPCCINAIEFDGDKCSVGRINETAHLHGLSEAK